MEWADGRKYEGEWSNNKKNGQGKETRADGIVKQGTWKEGKRVQN